MDRMQSEQLSAVQQFRRAYRPSSMQPTPAPGSTPSAAPRTSSAAASGRVISASLQSSEVLVPVTTSTPLSRLASSRRSSRAAHISSATAAASTMPQSRQAQGLAAARALDAVYNNPVNHQQQLVARPHSTTRAAPLPRLMLLQLPPPPPAAAAAAGAARQAAAAAVSPRDSFPVHSSSSNPARVTDIAAPRQTPWGWPPPQLQPQDPAPAAASSVLLLGSSSSAAAAPAAVRVGGGYRLLRDPPALSSLHRSAADRRPVQTAGTQQQPAGARSINVRPRQGHGGVSSSTAASHGSSSSSSSYGYGILSTPFAAAAAQAAPTPSPLLEAASARVATATATHDTLSVQATGPPARPALEPAAAMPHPSSAAAAHTSQPASSALPALSSAAAANSNVSSSRDSSSVLSLQELLEAVRQGYSPLPTSPRLARPPTGPALPLVPLPPVTEDELEGGQDSTRPGNTRPSTASSSSSSSSSSTTAAAAAAVPAPAAASASEAVRRAPSRHLLTPPPPAAVAYRSPTGPSSRAGTAAAAAAPSHAAAAAVAQPTESRTATPAAASVAASSADSSGSNGSSGSSGEDVLLAIQLLTDSLQIMREMDSLINDMLGMHHPPRPMTALGSGPQALTEPQSVAQSPLEHSSLAGAGAGAGTLGSADRTPSARRNLPGSSSSSSSSSVRPSCSARVESSASSGQGTGTQHTQGSGGSTGSSSAPAGNLTTCVVCIEAQRSVLLLPCRHLVLCGRCFGRMSSDAEAAAARQREERQSLLGAGRMLPDLLGPDSPAELLQRLLQEDELRDAAAAAGFGTSVRNAGPASAGWVQNLPMPPAPTPAAAGAAGAAGDHSAQQPAAAGIVQVTEDPALVFRRPFEALVRQVLAEAAAAEAVGAVGGHSAQQSAAAGVAQAAEGPAGGAPVLGRLGEALVRQVLEDAAAAAAAVQEGPHSTAAQQQQHDAATAAAAAANPGRRSARHREWLGRLPPGVPSGVLLPARDEQVVAAQAGRSQGVGLEVRGVGLRMQPEGVRAGSVGLRCPMCRAAVEQSVCDVLIV